MSTQSVYDFLREITRCDYTTAYSGPIEAFAYNGVTYAQGAETYQTILEDKFNLFKTAVLDISLQDKGNILSALIQDFKKAAQTYYDIPDEDYIQGMERDEQGAHSQSLRKSIKEARFLNEMVSRQKWFLSEAISFLGSFTGKTGNSDSNSTLVEAPQVSPLGKRLSEYGDYLSVEDLTKVFGCVSRTISNWEQSGIISSISPKSSEMTSLGKRKRGAEKRYRKSAIIQSTILQEKYNDLKG